MTDSLPSDFVADGQPFENPEAAADVGYAATVPSLGAKLEADFGEGLTAALGRAGQRGKQAGASWFDRLAATPDIDTAAGMVAGGQDPYPEPAPSPTLSAEDANKRFAPPGTTITDGPITEDLARVVGQQKAKEIKRESVLSRYAVGHGTMTNLGVGLALSPLMDPVGSAAFFVPGIGEEAVAAHLGEGLIARTGARAVAGASAGAIGMGVAGAAKYALGTEQSSDYTLRSAMYDLASGAALGALGHAGFGALREAGILRPDGLMEAERSRAAAGLPSIDAPIGLVSNEDLGAVLDAPATARLDALNAGVSQVLDGRQVDVTPIFDQVRADRAEAELQRWTAQQGRLDAQSTAALRASSVADIAASTIESRADVLQRRLDDLRGQHAGFLADIEDATARQAAQVDTVTPERLRAIDAELSDTAIPAARRADLQGERALLTEGRDPAADALEVARTEAVLRGLQRGAAAVQAEIDRNAPKVGPLQDQAAARRAAGSDALGAASDRIAPQEEMLRSLAARSIRRYASAFNVPVTRDEADALATRALRGGAGETARVVAEIRGRAVQGKPTGSPIASSGRSAPALPGPPIEQQRAAIASDVVRQLTAAGRPENEARTAGRLVAAHYEARASRFGGALGTAEELYRDRAPEIRGPEDDAAPVPAVGGDGGAGGAAEAADITAGASLDPEADPAAGGEIAPGESAPPAPEAVEHIAAEVMPDAVEPVRAIVEAEQQVQAATVPGAPRTLAAYAPEAVTGAPRGRDTPAGVFLFDPLALAVDAERFQFKSDGDAQGVTAALRGVTRWDPAKAQSIMVWEAADGRLFVADGHQRAGLARRLTEQGQASGIELPGVLYRERDGVPADDARAIAAVTNIANGSGSALDGAKVLRARPDLLDGSVPLSAGKGGQAAALARLGDDAFRMVVNDVVPENYGAVVGQMIPADAARQVAALKAIARFEPRSVEEATVLTQRVASAELLRAEAGAQGSLFGDLDAPESTAGEEMRIVAHVIRDLRRDRGLFSRVVENAGRLEQAGSTIARDAARSAATDASVFAKVLSSDAYTAGPTRTALIAAARELKDGRITIGDASARLHAALGRSLEEDGAGRLGSRLGAGASEGGALDFGAGGSAGDGAATGDLFGPEPGGTRDAAAGEPSPGPAAGSAGGRGDAGGPAGRPGRTGGQGREDAAARARRGNRRAAARDGDALGRLIGDDAASRVVPLHDGILDRGADGEASLVEQMNDLLGRKPADAPRGGPSLEDEMADLLGRPRSIAEQVPAGSAPTAPLGHPDLIEVGDHVVRRVAGASDARTYSIYQRPEGGLDGVAPDSFGDPQGYATLSRHDDGRWEVGSVHVGAPYRRQGLARKLYAAIERDLGIRMRPSGYLLPDGYAMWRARDPEAVKWHQEVEGSYLSPKALRDAANETAGEESAFYRELFDRLPPEAKTADALRTMFQHGVAHDPLAALMAALDRAAAEHEPIALHARPMSESGIVDPHASVWRLYHGTGAPEHFTRFDPSVEGSRTGGAERGALFTSPRPGEADTYAESRQNLPPGAAGARVFPLDVRPGNTAVYDVGRLLAERDPRFMAASRAEFDAGYGAQGTGRDRVYADALKRFDDDVAYHEDLKDRLGPDHGLPDFPAMSNLLHPQAAAIRMAREDGRDTAILRGLGESAGGDQVVVLKPGFVTSAIDPEHLFYQGRGARPQGSITFRPGDRPLVRLMRDADASTFVHEMGHDWLEQMMTDAAHPAAPEAFRADAAAVRGWLGSDGGLLTEDQHETFARGFEQYLRAGVAPAPELAGVFAQFRGWLTRIYRTMRGLGAEISPDIRGVFDRLLTAEGIPERPAVPARPDVAALARQQQAVYRAGFAPGMPQAEFDALNEAIYGAKGPGGGEVRAAAPATSAARAGDAEDTSTAGTPARTAADATLAAWQQRFEAAGVVPSAEERALLDDTAARLKAADRAADGYAQAGECLTAAGI